MPFRNQIPIRRAKPTKTPVGDKWSEHKPDLKEDFNDSCGYCDSYDGYRHTYYEVDHFIPKSFFLPLGKITLTQYDNLVYSCKFCNNSKSSKWPTRSLELHNENDKGFIDPCNIEYENHFHRTEEGGIMWSTELGKWMFKNAFKFDERQQSLKLLWNLRRLELVINGLSVVLGEVEDESDEYKTIKEKIGTYCFEYFKIHQALIKFYNGD